MSRDPSSAPPPRVRRAHDPPGVRVGSHYLLELHGCPFGVLNAASVVERALRDSAREGDLTVVDVVVHVFSPHGVTGVAILRESHLSVHTWPELGYAAADVFTCGTGVHPERACTSLVRGLEAAHYTMQCIPREALPSGAPLANPVSADGG